MIEFAEDFWKEVFNGKSSLANNFELFVPSKSIYIKMGVQMFVCLSVCWYVEG